jgi:hypothetical protein
LNRDKDLTFVAEINACVIRALLIYVALSAVLAFNTHAFVVLADSEFAALSVIVTPFATMVNAGFASATILCRLAIHLLTGTAGASH